MSANSLGFLQSDIGISSMQVVAERDLRAPSLVPSIIEHHCKPILHVASDGTFYCCGSCGKVLDDMNEILSSELNIDQQIKAGSEDHELTSESLINPLGSDHAYRSKANVGIGFELGNPWGKDFAGKRIKAPVLNDGYAVGQLIERNGHIIQKEDGKCKFKIDYSRDKWFIDTKKALFQLLSERQRDIVQRTKAGRIHRKVYSRVVIDILPELIAEMADRSANIHNEEDGYAEESERMIGELVEKLRACIFEIIEGPLSPK